MSIAIRNILKIPILRKSKIIAGEKGIDNQVDGIALMESIDSIRWLKPNNLVITNAQILKEEPKIGKRIVRTLAKRNVAGIALKLNRYIQEVPAAMKKAADELNFAIIGLPYNITSTQIINAVSFEIFRAEIKQPRYEYENDFLQNLILNNIDSQVIHSTMLNMGWTSQMAMAVLVIKDKDLIIDDKFVSLCKKNGFSRCFPLQRHTVVIAELEKTVAEQIINLGVVPEKGANTLLESVLSFYRDMTTTYPTHRSKIGIGIPVTDLTAISQSYYQSQISLYLNLACESDYPLT